MGAFEGSQATGGSSIFLEVLRSRHPIEGMVTGITLCCFDGVPVLCLSQRLNEGASGAVRWTLQHSLGGVVLTDGQPRISQLDGMALQTRPSLSLSPFTPTTTAADTSIVTSVAAALPSSLLVAVVAVVVFFVIIVIAARFVIAVTFLSLHRGRGHGHGHGCIVVITAVAVAVGITVGVTATWSGWGGRGVAVIIRKWC
ncbi:hypothetical protein EDB89DRAFT_2135622 [Lactarius sanguifluus]|nr:hypothetical protein EDB89DRAFT_2135622 [Lactarius sanguifluus]